MIATLVVLVYDQRSLAVEAIKSAVTQEFQDFEVLVTVDHGDIHTGDLVSELVSASHHRCPIKVIRTSRNRGPAWCYNAAIKEASGKYIAFLDGDDIWFPSMLTCQVGAISSLSVEVPGVVGRALIAEAGNSAKGRMLAADPSMLDHVSLILRGAHYPVLSALYRTEAIQSMGVIPDHLRVCDYFLATRITEGSELADSDCICGQVRSWSGSMSSSGARGGMTMDRLETVVNYISGGSSSVRGAALEREKRLLNQILLTPQGVPVTRMRKYLIRRPGSFRAWLAFFRVGVSSLLGMLNIRGRVGRDSEDESKA